MSSLKYDCYWVNFHGFWNFYINFERTVVHHHREGARAEFEFTNETIASPDLVVGLNNYVHPRLHRQYGIFHIAALTRHQENTPRYGF